MHVFIISTAHSLAPYVPSIISRMSRVDFCRMFLSDERTLKKSGESKKYTRVIVGLLT